jgi:hypothetical protein
VDPGGNKIDTRGAIYMDAITDDEPARATARTGLPTFTV